jgi:hypothetical protein
MTLNRAWTAVGLASAVLAGSIHLVGAARGATGPSIDPANFTTKIDNPLFPLKPRATFTEHVAQDMAEVLSTNETITVPFGTFTGCLLAKEFSPLDKKVVEHKWYAPGIGFVKSVMVQGGSETSELVKVTGF